MAPNATWDRPSPIKEKRFRTRGAEGYQDTYDKGIAYKGIL